MDTNNICIGLVIKNYKEMCSLLNEEIKAGSSKKAQLKEWERYIKYHKDGNKFIVDEIYDVPKEKEDNRSLGLNSIYSKDLQPLILDLLSQAENKGMVCLSCNMLLKELQMVNRNYSLGRNNIPELSKILKVDENIIYDFYNYTHTNLKNVLESSLNSLRKQSLLSWSKQVTVCIEEAKIITNELGQPKVSKGSIQYSLQKEYRLADDEEVQLILEVERNTLDGMNCESMGDIVKRGQWEDFRSIVNSILKDKGNILFYYDSYKIISNPDMILKKLGRFDKTEKRDSINDIIFNQISKTIENKHDNSCEKVAEVELGWNDTSLKERHILRSKPNYVDEATKVEKAVIPRTARVVRFNKIKDI